MEKTCAKIYYFQIKTMMSSNVFCPGGKKSDEVIFNVQQKKKEIWEMMLLLIKRISWSRFMNY
jgi:hypothetical protein